MKRKILVLVLAATMVVLSLGLPASAETSDAILFNGMTTADNLWIGTGAGEVKAEVFEDDGVQYGRFVPVSESADTLGNWFSVTIGSGSGELDITGAKYVYFYVKAPADFSLTFSFELVGGGRWLSNKDNFEVLQLSKLSDGWVTKSSDGDPAINMKLDAGFEGWVRLDLNNLNDDNGTAIDHKSIEQASMWINDTGKADAGNAVTFGAIYLAPGDEAVPGLPAIPAPQTGAAEIRDFDNMTAVGQDLTEAGGLTNAFWAIQGANGLMAVTSDQGVANGQYSCEIVNSDPTDNVNYTQGALIGSYANTESIKGKRYIAFHLVVPGEPEWKNPLRTDQYDNPIFGVCVSLRTVEEGATIYWSNKGGEFANEAKLLKDGGSQLVDALTLENFVLVPFGFSGWVVLDTENYAPHTGESSFSFANAGGANVWELWLTQAGKRTGSVYFDSLYAFNEGEEVPGMVFTSGGNDEIGYFDRNMENEETTDPTDPTDEETTDPTTEGTTDAEDKTPDVNVETGIATGLAPFAVAGFGSAALLAVCGKKRKNRRE